jgi:rhamnulokinase
VTRRVVAAIDIGASGGRVMAGIIEANRVTLDSVHRFENGVVDLDGHLRWNITALFEEVLDGLTRLAARYPTVESIGVDTWAVDYGLLDANGALLAEPISYRDQRTAEAVHRVHAQIGEHDLFSLNGLQFLPFNTVYQLAAEQVQSRWDQVAHIVLLPDLIAFWLTGMLRTEYTNATTTGLVDVRTGGWSAELLERLRIRPTSLPPIEQPGTTRGSLLPHIAQRVGMHPSTVVTTVGSHDTASAVVGVPAGAGHFAYIASGTWSLVGLELDHPVVTPSVRDANFTNEGGVDGRIRFLRNVGGLWLLQESMRTWAEAGTPHDLHALLDDAAALPSGGPTFDVDDDIFIPPDDMPNRIAAAVVAAGRLAPASPAVTVRCVLDSLAAGYARTLRQASEISGRRVDVIHVVGGGSQNELLCQLTADSTRVPVIAGPVEATALGNVLVQARAVGAVSGTLEILRTVVAESTHLRRYEPCKTP